MQLFGSLYLVGVPLGNILDFSFRSLNILNKIDIIASEDTRKVGLFLKKINIKKHIVSLNTYNEKKIGNILINNIKQGKNIAIISDAGMPILNDPGFYLLLLAKKNKIKIKKILLVINTISRKTNLTESSLTPKSFI